MKQPESSLFCNLKKILFLAGKAERYPRWFFDQKWILFSRFGFKALWTMLVLLAASSEYYYFQNFLGVMVGAVLIGLVWSCLLPSMAKLCRGRRICFALFRLVTFGFCLLGGIFHTDVPSSYIYLSLIFAGMTGVESGFIKSLEKTSLEIMILVTLSLLFGIEFNFNPLIVSVVLASYLINISLTFLGKVFFYIEDQLNGSVDASRERSEKLEELIRGMAHSLGGFTMTIDLISYRHLNNNSLESSVREEWTDIQKSIQDLNKVVRDIRTIQKTTSGEEQIPLESIDLSSLFSQLYIQLDEATSLKNLDFTSNLDPAHPIMVWGNQQILLENVFSVLANTLISAAQEWETIALSSNQGKSKSVLIFGRESDLPPQKEQKIFAEPDFTPPKLFNEGASLQLAIVDFYVKEMGGSFFTLDQLNPSAPSGVFIFIFENVHPITKRQLSVLAS